MDEKQEVSKDKTTEKSHRPKDLKFKLGEVKGFEEAVKRLKLGQNE